jgi:endonuclease-8
MPEGDTIWRTAAGVRERVGGRAVGSAWPARFEGLVGRTLDAVEAVGKHLLMRFSGGWTLHSHMRMTGSWHLYRPGERWRQPRHRARAVLGFGDWEAVCFAAPVLELVRDGREPVGHLGPDVLAEEFPLDHVVARARSVGPVPVGELLLDQRVCSGVGNVYRCEALWELRRDPLRSSAELNDEALGLLFETARAMMRENLTVAGPRRFGGRSGVVHGRAGRPCPRCGALVRARAQGADARIAFWCPGCQVL